MKRKVMNESKSLLIMLNTFDIRGRRSVPNTNLFFGYCHKHYSLSFRIEIIWIKSIECTSNGENRKIYCQIANIRPTKSHNLNISRLVMQLSPIHLSQVLNQEWRCSWQWAIIPEHMSVSLRVSVAAVRLYNLCSKLGVTSRHRLFLTQTTPQNKECFCIRQNVMSQN